MAKSLTQLEKGLDERMAARRNVVKFTPWREMARPEQIRPDDCNVFVVRGGRSSGKSRTGAEDALERMRSGDINRIHVVAPTFGDARDICIEGPSGIKTCARPGEVVNWNRSMGEMYFANGCYLKIFSADEPDRLNGPQCFVAGTPVSTPLGSTPIEHIREGDLVLTRAGSKRVWRTNNRTAQVGEIRFKNDSVLVVTADHLVYHSKYGWTRADRLKAGDTVCAIAALNGAEESGIATMAATTNIEERDRYLEKIGIGCIGPSGNQFTDLFQRDSTCIIRTRIKETTLSTTLNSSPSASTQQSITSPKLAAIGLKSLSLLSDAPTAGQNCSARVAGGNPDVQNATASEPKSAENCRKFVENAEQNSSLGPEITAVSVASTWQPLGERSVYCLSVTDQPEFFANGILVHNCGHIWCDEFYACGISALDQALIGNRLGKRITSCYTSTPKATASTRYVLKMPNAVVRRLKLEDNAANLAPGYIKQIREKYAGTRLARVELDGELLEDVEGALWLASWFEAEGFRLPQSLIRQHSIQDPRALTRFVGDQIKFIAPVPLRKIVIALDPSVTDPELKKNPHKDPDETGLVAVGAGEDGRGYVLADMSGVMAPEKWAKLSLRMYSLFGANAIVAEANQGGELIRETIKSYGHGANIVLVHAAVGKRPRAEPVAALYEQGRASHCGELYELENQLSTWNAMDPSQRSPGRLDALAWGFHGVGLCDIQPVRGRQHIQKQQNL